MNSRFLSRTNKANPISRSRSARLRLALGCEILRRRAAPLRLPAETTAWKTSSRWGLSLFVGRFRPAQPVAVEATLAIGERGFAAWAFLDWSIGFPFAIRPPLSLAAILLHDLSRLRFGPARTHHPICIFRGRLVVSP